MVRPNDNNCNEDVDYNVDSNDNVHIFGRQIRIIMKMACDNVLRNDNGNANEPSVMTPTMATIN